jgi:aminoglycoside N3'-acetyltransferase
MKTELNKNIFDILENLNIVKNDRIYLSVDLLNIHANLNLKKKIDLNRLSKNIFNVVLEKIGKKGSIVVPVFNFECIKLGNYDRMNSSSETGSFGKYLLEKYPGNRSIHPINSFLIFGRGKHSLINKNYHNCHGPKSHWSYFLKHNFKLVTLGHHYVRSFTIVHYLERRQKVNYRFDKIFKVIYKDIIDKKTKSFSFFARKKNICDHSTITLDCDKYFYNNGISKFYKFKKLINFSIELKGSCKILIKDLKKKRPVLLKCKHKNKNKSVLDHQNTLDLELKYKNYHSLN